MTSKTPVDRDAILSELAREGYQPRRSKELARDLGVPKSAYVEFRNLLRELHREEVIERQRGGRWALPSPKNCIEGTIQLTRSGCGFVIPDDPSQEDLYIPEDELGHALSGDRVLAEVVRSQGRYNRPFGIIERILKRGSPRLVAEIIQDGWARPEDTRNPYDFRLEPSGQKLKPHWKILLEVTVWPDEGPEPAGKVVEVLGPSGDPDTETAAILARHDAPGPFSEAVKNAARACSLDLPEAERKRRLDLTDLCCFTIDPEDARDFDDALSLTVKPDGVLEVGVHIADVSYFVQPGSPLDEEARERATSIYLPGRVIPMLPEEVSNNVCSLRPDEDRCAKTVFLKYDREGNRLGYTIHRSLIHSRRRFTYPEALALVDGKASGEDEAAEVLESLRGLHDLAQTLRQKRMDNLSIELSLSEQKIVMDEKGDAVDVVEVAHDVSHQLVEEFMLAANCAVAEWCHHNGLPVLHRVHESPSEEDGEELAAFLTACGYPFKPPFDRRRILEILERARGKPEEHAINMAVLRSFKKAVYGPASDVGHFALNFQHYLHFTSPIRRYPDLHLHQQLDAALGEKADKLPKKLHKAIAGGGAGLEGLGMHTSQRERRAMEIEEAVKDFRRLELLSRRDEREFKAIVTGIQKFGIFVEITDYFVESLIPKWMLERKGFSAVEEAPGASAKDRGRDRRKPKGKMKRRDRGQPKRERRGFHIGQEVQVRITRIDLPARQCEMELVGVPKGE